MQIGLLAYATNTGLGHQTMEFHRHMNPAKTLVADLSRFNGMKTHRQWYPDGRFTRMRPTNIELDWLVEGMDIVFVAENPMGYHLFESATNQGVVSVQQYNYEFLDYFHHGYLAKPTVLAAPTTWNIDVVREQGWAPVTLCPVPVNTAVLPYRERDTCKTFAHIIGRPAAHDRNGTLEFLKAAKILGPEFAYKVYYQRSSGGQRSALYRPISNFIRTQCRELNVKVIVNTPDYHTLYTDDVLVIPRKYGGLCLPMQEALASGMPVVMTDVSPNNAVLPREWLAESTSLGDFTAKTTVEMFEANAESLAERMRQFADPTYVREASRRAAGIAQGFSWETLAPRYTEFFTSLLEHGPGCEDIRNPCI